MTDYTDVDIIDPDVIPYSLVGSADGVPPVVTFVSPTPGSNILNNVPIVVDITDAVEILHINIWVEMAASREVTWSDSTGDFNEKYADYSTRTSITNGYRFSIWRQGGWFAPPKFYFEVIDASGNISI